MLIEGIVQPTMVVAVVASHVHLLIRLCGGGPVWDLARWLRCELSDKVLLLEALAYLFHPCMVRLCLEVFFSASDSV